VGLSLGKIRETLHPPFPLGRKNVGLNTSPLSLTTGIGTLAVQFIEPSDVVALLRVR
jgi:hypothetical protein